MIITTPLKSLTVSRLTLLMVGGVMGWLSISYLAHSHHSMSRFDTTDEETITGTVTKYEWANPHVYIYVEQSSADGEPVEWEIEAGPPAILYRQGWSRETLRVGQRISVSGNPTKDQTHNGLYLKSLEQDEETLFDEQQGMQRLISGGPEPDSRADSLEGTWGTLLSMEVVLSFYPPGVATTEKGLVAVKAFDEDTMHPGLDCVPYTAPIMMVGPDTKQIRMESDRVIIESDFDGVRRVVHLNTSRKNAEYSIHGHSIGHWEDDTLVIDTTHFADHRQGNGFRVPSGAQKHLAERLTLNADGKGLTYNFVLTDPEFLSEPIRGEVTWGYRPDLVFEPLACDPENARRFLDHQQG